MPGWLLLVIILLTLTSIAVWVGLAIKHRRQWLYSIPPVLWLVNLLVFSVVGYARSIGLLDVNPITLNVWSASVILLAVITTLGIGLVWYAEGTPYDDIG
jgi:hypothetical protein